MNETINRFLNHEGKVKQVPAKMSKKILLFDYLGTKFENNKVYTEQEVNKIITDWSTIDDYFVLRRGLVDSKQLSRTPDGSEYRKTNIELGE